MIKEITVKTTGMSCTSCERIISQALLRVDGIKEAKAVYTSETTKIKYDDSKVDAQKIRQAVENAGYDYKGEVKAEEKPQEKKKGLFGFKF